MLLRSFPVLTAAVALVTLAAAPADATTRHSCAKVGVTIAATSQVRVYSTGREEDDAVLICGLRTGKRSDIGDYGQCDGVGQAGRPAIAGRMVALALLNCDETGYFASVGVFDADTGKSLPVPDDAFVGEIAGNPDELVTQVVVDAKGNVAWIVQNTSYSGAVTREVVKVGTGGKRILLDTGRRIDRGSLRAQDGELSWRNRGLLKTSTLP